jgi:DNA-binding transcriptional regulator YdaS (Cro superfamily)
MGIIVRFPAQRHVRASSLTRAAKRVSKSDVRPADLAPSVDKIAPHHSEGMLSRLNHLITAQLLTPTSEAIASRESQSSMTERNDAKPESDMPEILGHWVPNVKAIMSHDRPLSPRHSVPMAEDIESIAESAWRDGFRARLRQAQGGRTQETMARLLGTSREAYSKYVGGRKSVMPVRLLPKFCAICDVSLIWLIEGDKAEVERQQFMPKAARR